MKPLAPLCLSCRNPPLPQGFDNFAWSLNADSPCLPAFALLESNNKTSFSQSLSLQLVPSGWAVQVLTLSLSCLLGSPDFSWHGCYQETLGDMLQPRSHCPFTSPLSPSVPGRPSHWVLSLAPNYQGPLARSPPGQTERRAPDNVGQSLFLGHPTRGAE